MIRPPSRGVAAHRGGSLSHPENTLAAFCEALRLGAAMIECDLRATRDGAVVVMHDETVDRTTDGHGRVADLSFDEIRRLDAGSWKGPAFAGERVPELDEVLEVVPRDVWLNLQVKPKEPVAAEVARRVVARDMQGQVLLGCGNAAAREARAVSPGVLVCNLVRQESRERYLEHCLATGSDFIQLHFLRGLPDPGFVRRAREAGLRVIHFCHPTEPQVEEVVAAGVDFPLVDDVAAALRAVADAS